MLLKGMTIQLTINDQAVAFSVPVTVPLMLTVGMMVALELASELAVGVVPSPVTVTEALDTVEIDCEYTAATPRAIWLRIEALILLLAFGCLIRLLPSRNHYRENGVSGVRAPC